MNLNGSRFTRLKNQLLNGDNFGPNGTSPYKFELVGKGFVVWRENNLFIVTFSEKELNEMSVFFVGIAQSLTVSEIELLQNWVARGLRF